MDKILIRGARTHNLKNIDLTLPRDKGGAGLTVWGGAVSVVSVFSDEQAATASTAATRARRFMQIS